ncbi:MAG: Nif3-like dinuclear metal center hexameric protein [candidate division KSB1 bacterium]|nr:Nif3-like dinuclear metal center hexameric protein [candidate division KSB1 bacterium]MDZ7392308.1 Nif3-like dinuclear metal center hexameric protein [candidate division KSB1 bacterium]MDZ7412213.1 Nif3-like dinuclear metal center hexameric protein [candidate division KSB1 bacterium]
MVARDRIVTYLNDLLQPQLFEDYGPQGLQVEGKAHVRKIVTGVSASLELFEQAHIRGADMVIVHHGLFWDRESRVATGALKKRLTALLTNDISLVAYHLPLDAHPTFGNNAVAARALGILDPQRFATVGWWGRLSEPLLARVLFNKIQILYDKTPLIFDYGPDSVETVGIVSGAGAHRLQEAVALGLDCFVTGEASEASMHLAKESGLHFVAAGHYATERLGIKVLGEQLAQEFGIEVEFLDLPNPV